MKLLLVSPRGIWAGILCVLSACGGSAYFGNVYVVPDASGAVAGFPAAALTTVTEGDLGFVYGYATDLDAQTFGAAGASSNDTANFAVAGVLPDANVGALPADGSATFAGSYAVVVVDGAYESSNAATWDVTEDGGPITLDVNFATGRVSGDSADGKLSVLTDATPSGPSSSESPLAFGFFGEATYDGISGYFEGEVGADGVVAAATGDDGEAFWAGGFVAD